MRNLLLSGIFLFLIIFPSYAFADGPYLNIPPTNAFDKIKTDNGTVFAANFSMPLNIIGGMGISVKSQNGTHTVTISNTQAANTNQGTYNKTLANNAVINSGGNRINFINGTNNPVKLANDPTRNQINVTISSTGGGAGVTSLNALTGALSIACVAGNTTCTSNGLNTITINTAYNIVTTGLSNQTITKGLTVNSLTLGGNANGGNKNFTGINNLNGTKIFQNGKQVLDTLTQGAGISITGSGNSRTITNTGILNAITSLNGQSGPSVNIVRQPSYTTVTNTTNQVKVGIDATGVMELNGTQTVTGVKTFSGGITMSGANIDLGTNQITRSGHVTTLDLTSGTLLHTNGTFLGTHSSGSIGTSVTVTSLNNAGHASTFPLTTGTLCQTNMTGTCGTNSGVTSITGTAHNVTASASTGAVTLNTGDNVVVTNGATQNFTKLIIHNAGLTMSHSNINLGSNRLQTTDMYLNQNASAGSNIFTMSSLNPNSLANWILYPSGTSKLASSFIARIYQPGTPTYEYLKTGTDIHQTGEFGFDIQNAGAGSSRSYGEYMNGTIISTINANKTITNAVDTKFSSSNNNFTNGYLLSHTHFGTDQGGSMEFGGNGLNPITNGVPYMDWHFGNGKNQDYNIRLQNNGNNTFIIVNPTSGAIMQWGDQITHYVPDILTPLADVTAANEFWKSSTTADVVKYRNNAAGTTYSFVSTISATNATRGQLSGNGTGTASASLVMDGVYATITPANTGRITVSVSGDAANSVSGDGCNIGIRQGTSNMGANGAAVAGTILGDNERFTAAAAAQQAPFHRTYDFNGIVGTKYFFDLGFSRITGGTCTLSSVNWDLVEH